MAENYYDGLPPVGRFMEKYGLRAKKSLGQNFICDLNLTDRIARSVPDIGRSVVAEVGSGPAGLTRSLLHNGAAKVLAIEIDGRAIGILEELGEKYGDRLEIIRADALSLDFKKLRADFAAGRDFRICSNLPYNISIPLLVKWIHGAGAIDSMTLMFQKEVGGRITAREGSKDYGRISVMASLAYGTKVLFKVSPRSFVPPPKVDSCVVEFQKRAEQPGFDMISKVEGIVKLAFSERRKMLRSTLGPLFGDTKEMEDILSRAGVSPSMRAEEVSPERFLELARIIDSR